MKVKRWCEHCGKEFMWEDTCRCGKNKHRPVCSPCNKIQQEAFMKNVAAQGADAIAEQIERDIIDGWDG